MKKGRASNMTRPQPTIYGNCDSWAFIVGKKRVGDDPSSRCRRRCDAATNIYQQLINNFDAIDSEQLAMRLWTSGGLPRNVPHGGGKGARYSDKQIFEAPILSKSVLAPRKEERAPPSVNPERPVKPSQKSPKPDCGLGLFLPSTRSAGRPDQYELHQFAPLHQHIDRLAAVGLGHRSFELTHVLDVDIGD